ncbi:MAG: hypothetical protein Q8L22_01820 [Reyranella sp.]|nr:hypothetical protein [Reyranella sp.]
MAVLLVVVGALVTGAWTQFLRLLRIEIVDVQRDVPIQVFGLGTVEAKVVSRVGFEVSSTLVDLHADFVDGVWSPSGTSDMRIQAFAVEGE